MNIKLGRFTNIEMHLNPNCLEWSTRNLVIILHPPSLLVLKQRRKLCRKETRNRKSKIMEMYNLKIMKRNSRETKK